MNDTLKTLAAELARAGLPALAGAIFGPAGSGAAGAVIGALADALGVPATVEAVQKKVADDPQAAAVKLRMLDLAIAEQGMAAQLAASESERGFFHSGWRPAWAWLCLWLTAWSLFLLPIVNVSIQSAFNMLYPPIAPIPNEILIQVIGIFLALYMGGNTAIRVVEQLKGPRK